jgi:CMP-N,N'-diacetyllegionaminic acid synthase
MDKDNKKVVLGITPARGGSKGIPRKNIIDLNGIPLIAHTIRQAKESKALTHYIVNSEDEEIRNVAASFGAETMTRPSELSHDSTLQEVDRLLVWTVNKFEAENQDLKVDIVVLLYPTAPLRDVVSIDKAIGLVRDNGYDSALSVYYDTRYLWSVDGKNKVIRPTNYDPNNRMPRQKESWNQWAENKAIYVMQKDVLFSNGRIGKKCGFVEMEKWRSIDIDEHVDLKMARSLITHHDGQ